MDTPDVMAHLHGDTVRHLHNVADNLQLVADLGYGDVALVVAEPSGDLVVAADARPNTAVAPIPGTRVGRTISRDEEPEAYEALLTARRITGERNRTARGIKYHTTAFPIGNPRPVAVVLHDLADQVAEAPGTMETVFMTAAMELLGSLADGPLVDVRTGEPFSTGRTAGDGVLRISATGIVTYASPNAVNIMRLGGFDRALMGSSAAELPGGGYGIAPVLGARGALEVEVEVAERALRYRTIALNEGVLALVQDVTESRRREAELKVKETTIREVHHRVKNNLQTIASLLRIQARRTDSEEVRRALAEATQRVSSMAVVHDLLAGSDEERVDFAQAARTVVDLVRRGLMGEDSNVRVSVVGETGEVSAQMATSLALAVAELVHNALEHGLAGAEEGEVTVTMRRVPGELVITVRDDGRGLPEGFSASSSSNLGLAIVRTVAEDDLRGTLTFSGGRGTTVTVRVPIENAIEEEGN